MWLNDKRLFMPSDGWLVVSRDPLDDDSYTVVEMGAFDKQKICPAFQNQTSVVGQAGERMVSVDIVLPAACFVAQDDFKSKTVGALDPDEHMMIPISIVVAWVWDDDRLRPPPKVVQ